MAVQRNVYVIF